MSNPFDKRKDMKKKLVVTVCNGNIHRSVLAQICLCRELTALHREKDVEIISRGLQGTMGTDIPIFPHINQYDNYAITEPCLREIGITIPEDQSTIPIDQSTVEHASLILAMDSNVLCGQSNSLHNQFPSYVFKMMLFSELVGMKTDVFDLHGSFDVTLHRKVTQEINDTSRRGIAVLLRLLESIP